MMFFIRLNRNLFSFNFFLVFCLSLMCNFFFNIAYADISNKVNKCVTCHTITGNSIVTIWPKIAEQHSSYIFKQLLEFKKGKDGDRFDPTMFGMLQEFNEADLLEFSNYFSAQMVSKSALKINKDEYFYGKNIYIFGDKDNNVTGCVGCHGIDGTGNKLAKFPSLKWQHKDYLIAQMKKFKTGERANDLNGIMRNVVSNMTDEQIKAVSLYLSGIE